MSLNSLPVNASSFSSSYSLQDEALDFSHNSDQLESSSYSMDLSTVFWTNRIGESASYSVVDSSSGETQTVSPPTPGGGGVGSSGGIAGGRRDLEKGEIDIAALIALEEIEIADNGLTLHPASIVQPKKEETVEVAYVIPESEVEDILKKEHRGDTDACSPNFEWTFLKTNTVENDSDGDGIDDCDEALLYGLDPLKFDESYERVGLTSLSEIVYSEAKPLLVGRGDFSLGETYSENLIQIEVQMNDPVMNLGLFFMKLDKDLNFAEILPIELFDGTFKTTLLRDGNIQQESDLIVINQTVEFTQLEVKIPDNGMLEIRNNLVIIDGVTGANYGVVALWKHNDFIDVSADITNLNGEFEIAAPIPFIDGNYEVIVYGLSPTEDYFVQTNYQQIRFKIEGGKAYILAETAEEIIPLWQAGLEYMNAELHYSNSVEIHDVSRESNVMYLISYFIFLTFVGLTFYALWSKSGRSKYS